jgi:hypothetical protein
LERGGNDDERTPQELLRAANADAVPDSSVLAAWGVSHVVATYPLTHERLTFLTEIDGAFVYRNLDFDAQVELNMLGWPQAGGPGLPDVEVVNQLNHITSIAALLAGLAFIGCVGLILWGRLRR